MDRVIEKLVVILKEKLENILTTDNPLSNRDAKAMTVGFSFSAVHVPVKLGLKYSYADLQRLSDPHLHCKQCFPRLDGPRGKYPWQGLSC